MKSVITFLCVAALALAAVYFGRSVLGGSVANGEWLLALLVATIGVARWRFVAKRRQRQKLQELRDSALW